MASLVTPVEVSIIPGCRRGDFPAQFVSNSGTKPRNLTILKGDEPSGSRNVRVCARVKEYEAQASGVEQGARLYRQFSAPVKQSSKRSKEEEDKQKYYVNMGFAIRTLREEFPELFYRELSFDIYREDIVFKDPLNTFVGIENYKSIFWALRFHGRLFFRALWVDVVGVWQPVENLIMVRWTVHGIPRVPWESRGRFDGVSEYKLDKDGKIFEHRVHNIALNSPPKFQVLAVEDLIHSIGCPSTPRPTYFEILTSTITRRVPPLVTLFWELTTSDAENSEGS